MIRFNERTGCPWSIAEESEVWRFGFDLAHDIWRLMIGCVVFREGCDPVQIVVDLWILKDVSRSFSQYKEP